MACGLSSSRRAPCRVLQTTWRRHGESECYEWDDMWHVLGTEGVSQRRAERAKNSPRVGHTLHQQARIVLVTTKVARITSAISRSLSLLLSQPSPKRVVDFHAPLRCQRLAHPLLRRLRVLLRFPLLVCRRTSRLLRILACPQATIHLPHQLYIWHPSIPLHHLLYPLHRALQLRHVHSFALSPL